jgi:hypothetical protein
MAPRRHCIAKENVLRCTIVPLRSPALASAKFLLRRAMACATLAKETEDDDCRERCLRLEQVYRRLAEAEEGHDPRRNGPPQDAVAP